MRPRGCFGWLTLFDLLYVSRGVTGVSVYQLGLPTFLFDGFLLVNLLHAGGRLKE